MSINDDITPFEDAFEPFDSDEAEVDEVDVDDAAEAVDPAVPTEQPEAAPDSETPAEVVERLYAGKYKSVEELERGYQEANKKLSQRQAPAPEPEPEPPPRPLFKGETSKIETEADLYNWAAADPEAAAMFAMENHARLQPDQMDNVMNNWIAAQPWKATTTIQAWQTQMLREEFAEQRALADSHVISQIRDEGIKQAIKEQPMLEDYAVELGEFIEQNPHLNQMVEGARSAGEVSKALEAIFYMMAGPQLSKQALEAQVAASVKAEQAEQRRIQREAKAAAETTKASSLQRNTAAPANTSAQEEADEALRQLILNPSGR